MVTPTLGRMLCVLTPGFIALSIEPFALLPPFEPKILLTEMPPRHQIVNHSSLNGDNAWHKEAANKLAVLKLNGGLGTSMGCTG